MSGQRRVVKENDVHVDYALRWQADQLIVTLQNNRPQDRNYIVYVVVEETLGSGEVLHTEQRVRSRSADIRSAVVLRPGTRRRWNASPSSLAIRGEHAASLRDIPGPRPGDPDPWPWREGLLGLDRDLFATDPVLRELQVASFSAPEEFGRVAAIALRHPPAARVLRLAMNEAQLSEEALVTMLESASGDLRPQPSEPRGRARTDAERS